MGSEMTQPAKVQEPSMEEILASIRRMIADDEAKPTSTSAAKAAEPARRATAAPTPQQAKLNDIPPPPKVEIRPARTELPKPAADDRRTPAPPAATPVPTRAVGNVQNTSNDNSNADVLMAGREKVTSFPGVRPPEPDVLELTDAMAIKAPAPPPQPSFRKVEAGAGDALKLAQPAPHRPAAPRSDPVGDSRSLPAQQPILAQSTVSAVESAFNTLASSVLSSNLVSTVSSGNARTLEDLVKEMLRPMLKAWLDDNLPGLVERLVRAEIERVSRGQ